MVNPEKLPIYPEVHWAKCGGCDNIYDRKEEFECCGEDLTDTQVWACCVCLEKYVDKDEAKDCCK